MTNSAPRQSSATPPLPDRAETRSGFWRLPSMTKTTRVWVSVGDLVVNTYYDAAHAVAAYDPHVNAWLDGDDYTLAQAARELAIFETRGEGVK